MLTVYLVQVSLEGKILNQIFELLFFLAVAEVESVGDVEVTCCLSADLAC